MASSKEKEGTARAPASPPAYVVTVHAADDATLSAARSVLGSTRELSAGGGATAAVEFFAVAGKPSSSSTTPKSTFDPALYFAALRTRSLGRCLLLSPLLPSTQDLVQRASSGVEAAARGGDGRALPEGTICVADAQGSGRGRGANAWASPPGCLMFSLSSDVRLPGTRLPFVQYLVSLALVRAARREVVEKSGGGSGGGGGGGGSSGGEDEGAAAAATAAATATAAAAAASIRIKWPNDLYAGGRKLAGVLCHSSYVSAPSSSAAAAAGGGSGSGASSSSSSSSSSCFRLTAGVGFNVTNEPPPGAASLAGLLQQQPQAEEAGSSAPMRPPPSLSRETLLAAALSELEPLLDALSSPAGFCEELRGAYEAAWLHSGQVVEVEEGAEMVSRSSGGAGAAAAAASAAESRRVRITGLSPSGFLAAVDADATGGNGLTRYELHPDGNSLDFFAGLVRKKAAPPPPRA